MDHSLGSAEEVNPVRILQSCNGLLLCSGSAWPIFYYVYNPSTNLFKILPQPNYYLCDDSCFFSSGVFRLAFDPRKSNHYKLVQAGGEAGETWIQIYSSKTGNWSFCKDRFSYFSFDHFESAIYWNDTYHWLEGMVDSDKGLEYCLGEGEEDAFVVINLSRKVVKYNLITKTNTGIFDIGSNQMDDDDDANDVVVFIPPFEVDPNIYEFIPSLASV
ncbi:hypothetical protein Tco_1477009 [Tanacetum coccineum]